MRRCNFIEAINSNLLTIDQIGGLSESQVEELSWKEERVELKRKVEEFLVLNQKKQEGLSQKKFKIYSDQSPVNLLFRGAMPRCLTTIYRYLNFALKL